MGSLAAGLGLRVLAAIACLVAVVWLALWDFIPAPPHELTIATGIENGAFSEIAEHYQQKLARQHIKLNVRIAPNSGPAHLALLEDPNSGVDAAFMFGGTSDSKQSPNLMSLGRIGYAPMWIVYRGTETIERLTELKGKRVSINPGILVLERRLLAAHGVTPKNTDISVKLGSVGIKALKDGEIDVAVLPPQEVHSPILQPVWEIGRASCRER